ncbi:tetratricopeptide repeat protein [Natroniella sulfidigena]|uniref:tetratricopeptide repeat protein n=1 Tax=Natroniella sulfidigena TaxID=723921 RepID=UPI00200B5147|nr:tetratricopeptide repeat protein [Natroniella sulfidigena]MCK8817303.1 tetratricopeptide repeat protein [Natroniella sulfidigena]
MKEKLKYNSKIDYIMEYLQSKYLKWYWGVGLLLGGYFNTLLMLIGLIILSGWEFRSILGYNPELMLAFARIDLQNKKLEKSKERLFFLINRYPKLLDAYFIAGKIFIQENNYTESEKLFKHIINYENKKYDLLNYNQEDVFKKSYNYLCDSFIKLEKYEKAINYLEKMKDKEMLDAKVYIKLGDLYDKLNNSKAYINYSYAYKLTQDYTTLKKLADYCYKKDKFEEAQKYYQHLIELKEKEEDIYKLSKISFKQRNYHTAEKYLKKLSKQKEDDPYIYLYLAYCKFKQEDYNNSITYLNKSWKKNKLNEKNDKKVLNKTDRKDLFYKLGAAHLEVGNYEKAKQNYRQVLGYDHNNFEASVKVGICLEKEGQYNKAIEIYKEVLELKPNLLTTYYGIIISNYQLGNYHEVIKFLKELIRKTRKPKIYQLYNQLGREEELISCLKELKEEFPKNYFIYINLALAYERLNNPQAAQNYLEAYRLKTKERVLKRLAIFYANNEKFEEAKTYFAELLDINYKNFEYIFNFGIVCYRLGDLREAINKFKTALDLRGDKYVEFYLHLAAVKYRDLPLSPDTVEEYLEKLGGSISTYIELGDLALEKTKYELAELIFKQGIEQFEDDFRLYYKLARLYAIQEDYNHSLKELKRAIILNRNLKNEILKDETFAEVSSSRQFKKIFN